MRKISLIIILTLFCCVLFSGCGKEKDGYQYTSICKQEEASNIAMETESDRFEKGFDLPISPEEKELADKDCARQMRLVADLYNEADKGDSSNVVLSNEVITQMQDRLAAEGYSVYTTVKFSNMKNWNQFEEFLNDSIAGINGKVVVYSVHLDGAVFRYKFNFDGTDIYVLTTATAWSPSGEGNVLYHAYTRIKDWNYTEQGWFCYELCVPEYPEVTEVVNGCYLIRVMPISEKNRELSQKYVLGLGYQGNNLLCSNWDVDHMEKLDLNGMYEYLYTMKYDKRIDSNIYKNGIPKDEFESLIQEFITITSEQIQTYAVYDSQSRTYAWAGLNCENYAPTLFGTSIPEVVDMKENEDGSMTMTVNAVCEMLGDSFVVVHKVTVYVKDDGSFQYLGNEILGDGLSIIPDYQYRFTKE